MWINLKYLNFIFSYLAFAFACFYEVMNSTYRIICRIIN